MPKQGGFEATAKIREWERENGLTRSPVIALTAHAMVGDREKCIQAQMDEYLSKPLKQNQLIQTIVKCATLGGALAPQTDQRNSVVSMPNDVPGDERDGTKTPNEETPRGTPIPNAGGLTPKRPKIENRAFTERDAGGDSPRLMSVDVADSPESVSLRCCSLY